MGDFYFFTNPNLIKQHSDEGYGPVSGFESTKFRTTSLHYSDTVDPEVIAVCDGTICVQGIDGTDTVNIFLKPTSQIKKILGINFAPIRYFVYRGVKKDSLIQTILPGNDDVIAPSSNNRLTKAIWDNQAVLDAEYNAAHPLDPPISTTPSSDLLLFNHDLAPLENMDALFFNSVTATYQLPSVSGGWRIGEFDKDSFGFEVVLDDVRNVPGSEYVKILDNQIEISDLPTTPTLRDYLIWKTESEKILGFMDPCALYGSMVAQSVQYRNSDTPFDSGTQEATFVVPPAENYNVYTNLLSEFVNKNTVYLDIRNEFNHSYNYNNNYDYTGGALASGDKLKVLFGRDQNFDSSSIDYYRDSYFSNWPILIIPADDGHPTSPTSTYSPGTNNSNRIKLKIRVPDSRTENKKPLWYISQGYLKIKSGGPKELLDEKDKFESRKFKSGSLASGDEYVNTLKIMIPNFPGNNITTPISCYVRLKLFKRKETNNREGVNSPVTTYRQEHVLDNLFLPVKMDIPNGLNSPMKVRTFKEDYYIHGDNSKFVASVGIAEDAQNVTFFAYIKDRRSLGNAGKMPISSFLSPKPHFINLLNEKYPVPKLVKGDISAGASYIRFIDTSGQRTSTVTADSPDMNNEFYALVLKKTTYDSILLNNPLSSDYDVRFVLENKQVSVSTVSGAPFCTYDLILRGLYDDGTEVKTSEYDPGVLLYGYNGGGICNILKEGDAEVDLYTPEDTYIDCTSTTFSQEELERFKTFIDEVNAQANGPSPFKPNVKLMEKVLSADPLFDADEMKKFGVVESGGVLSMHYPADYTEYQGYLVEAITTFVLWGFMKDMEQIQDRDGAIPILTDYDYALTKPVELSNSPGLTGKIVPEIYKKLYDILILNGFIEPDSDAERADFNKMLQPNARFGQGLPTFAINYTGAEANITSMMKEMAQGNFTALYGSNPRRFTFPYNVSGPGAEPLINATVSEVLKDLTNEIAFLVQRDVKCFWKKIFSEANYESSIADFRVPKPPEGMYLATGEGSGTTGLLGKQNDGILFFTYKISDEGVVQFKNEQNFISRDTDVKTSIHISAFGVDAKGKDRDVNTLHDNQPRYDIKIVNIDDPTDYFICRFTSVAQHASGQDSRLVPEWSLDTTATIPTQVEPPPAFTSSTFSAALTKAKGTRFGLDPGGTGLELVGTTTLTTDSEVNFFDSAGAKVANWNPDTGDLTVEALNKNVQIKVEVQSATALLGNARPVLDPRSGIPYHPSDISDNKYINSTTGTEWNDEMTISLTVFDGPEVPLLFTPTAEDLFDADKFELKLTDKADILCKDDNLPGFKTVAELIHNGVITSNEIEIVMIGHHVGMVDDSARDNEPDVKADPLYSFTRPRPVLEPNPVTAAHVKSTCVERKPHSPGARILEVALHLDEEFRKPLRYSHAKIEYVRSTDMTSHKLVITINSFVSPRWSRLDKNIGQDYRLADLDPMDPTYSTVLANNEARIDNQLIPRTLFGADPLSDAYIIYGTQHIASFNPVLSALRCYGLLEAIRDNILTIAEDSVDGLGLTGVDLTNIENVLDTSIDATSIDATGTGNGRAGAPITYAVYENLKWYKSSSDEDEYHYPSIPIPSPL